MLLGPQHNEGSQALSAVIKWNAQASPFDVFQFKSLELMPFHP